MRVRMGYGRRVVKISDKACEASRLFSERTTHWLGVIGWARHRGMYCRTRQRCFGVCQRARWNGLGGYCSIYSHVSPFACSASCSCFAWTSRSAARSYPCGNFSRGLHTAVDWRPSWSRSREKWVAWTVHWSWNRRGSRWTCWEKIVSLTPPNSHWLILTLLPVLPHFTGMQRQIAEGER